MNRACIAVLLILWASAGIAQQSADEQAVWKLEHSYWEYVKADDRASYKSLWHENFLGWPSFSPQPVGKDHITDWLTNYGAKGLHLKSYSLKPAASRATGELVVVHYWVTSEWAGKNGSEQSETRRITHTWLRAEKGWQIISGMSADETQTRK